MNKTRKFSIKRTLLAFMLIAALIGVQVIEIVAYAADEGTADQQQMVEVSTYDELVAAIDAAQDGDVIGILSEITVPKGSSLGSSGKTVTLQRSGTLGMFTFEWLAGGEISTVQNVVFDGAGVSVGNSFLTIYHNTNFEGVTFKNCISSDSGGAANVQNGSINLVNCTFADNTATRGGHIGILGTGIANLTECTLTGGNATVDGGAIFIQNDASCIIQNSTVKANAADMVGGGIYNLGKATIQSSKVFKNTATNGVDIYNKGGFAIETGITDLETIFADEVGIIVKGWLIELEDITNASFMKLDYEVIPTEVILAESSLGVAGDSKITGLEADKHYKVSCGETVSYSNADGTLTLDEAESQPLTGTEITGLTNGQVYLVEEYTKPTTPDPEPSTVILETDSLGAAGNGKITDLPSGKKYKVSSDGVISYSKSDGTLTSQESDASELVGSEIVGLTNGKTYKVEEYIPTPTPKPDEPKDEVTTPPTNNSTSNTTTNNDNSSIRHDNSETKNDYSTVNNYYTTDSSTHTSTTKTEAPKPSDESVVAVMATTSPSPSTSEPVTQDDVSAEKVSEAASAFKNIRIEANGADCVFEINEDGYTISINANSNSQAAASGSTSSMNWYELVKVCLLAAIAVTLQWKPRKAEKSDLI